MMPPPCEITVFSKRTDAWCKVDSHVTSTRTKCIAAGDHLHSSSTTQVHCSSVGCGHGAMVYMHTASSTSFSAHKFGTNHA